MMVAARYGDIEILTDRSALADRAAGWLLDRAAAIPGRASVCLSGGEACRLLYEALAARWRERFPWNRVHWFWGDERFVPASDPRNNYRMVKRAMLDRAPAPPANIHPIATEGVSLAESAAAYEDELKRFYGFDELRGDRPLFDICILGLGPDGHTASLFPGAPVLEERRRWVAPVAGFSDEPRVTLTYPALESAAQAAFVVSGAETAKVLAEIWQGGSVAPAARLRPIGSLIWLADRAAAPGEGGNGDSG